ncbi:MAG: beta-ketoacyl-[acyl-carrier-protein] synthase family protein [Pseudomonadota bacterium]
MQALILSSFTVSSAAGCGNKANINSLLEKKTGLIKNNFLDANLDTWIGRVADVEQQKLPQQLKKYQCRNNQLAYLALQYDHFSAAIERAKKTYGKDKIGIFLGTSTSGILTTELAYQKQNFSKLHFRQQHNSFSIADFVQHYFQLAGPAQVVSTACSSSAKVFATASRYIEMGLCDAAIVGGVDSLCLTTLFGFNSLELVAREICQPADQNRKGLSIGEAAAFVLLEKAQQQSNSNEDSAIYLLGYGESSDAYHMSSPHPEGIGAIKAMQSALSQARLQAQQVDYINLHGTATPVNDKVEDIAIDHLFPYTTRCSSTKGWTGHTLGAAGAVEAVYSALCIQNNILPISLNTSQLDKEFKSNIVLDKRIFDKQEELHIVASNSFGFGGNNCCLIFGDQK